MRMSVAFATFLYLPQLLLLLFIVVVIGGEKNCSSDQLIIVEISDVNVTVANYECKNDSAQLPKMIRKCCPLDRSFDAIKKRCVLNEWKSLLNHTKFIIGLTIRHGNVLRDYSYNLQDINMAVDENYTILIKDKFYSNENYCIDRDYNAKNEERYVVRVLRSDYDVCEKNNNKSGHEIKCIRKCCPDGQCYYGKPHCTPCSNGLSVRNNTRIKQNEDDFALIHGSKCKKYVGYENKYDFYLDEHGYFHIKLYKNPFYLSFRPEEEMYCLEHAEAQKLKGDFFFICFQPQNTKFKFQITRIGLILSCVFLILTLAGYGFLPEMQNLFGKTLMCYCSALLLLFALLAHLQFNEHISNNRDICAAYGFIIMFASLASFAWLNTMCFDIWWTFGRIFKLISKGGDEFELRELEKHQVVDLINNPYEHENHANEGQDLAPKGSMSMQHRHREKKRFLLYNIYGWCLPISLTALTSGLHYSHILPKSIHPEIGGSKCYFEKINNNYGYHIFFVLPITIIFVCNAVLFTKTVIYCMKVKSEINRMNDTNAAKSAKKKGFIADKEKMMLLLKLFIVMGISWLFEAVSSMISFEENDFLRIVEIVWDTINSLQGLYIFLIFICKRKVLEAFRKKFGIKRRRQSVTSGVTHSTTLMSKGNSTKDTSKSS